MYLKYCNTPSKNLINLIKNKKYHAHIDNIFLMSCCLIITLQVAFSGLQIALQSPAAYSEISSACPIKLAVVMVKTGPAEDLLSAANRCMLPPGVNQDV